ncbi:hypothetical protein BFW01_g575 [Lasiodiplodia theobromae]|nr:hypothetical protein BFW01_g575 [Lasiodiplodia theobromae]
MQTGYSRCVATRREEPVRALASGLRVVSREALDPLRELHSLTRFTYNPSSTTPPSRDSLVHNEVAHSISSSIARSSVATMRPPPLPRNPTTAFHSFVRRFFTQSAQEPSNRAEWAAFFLFEVYRDFLLRPKSYNKYHMTPEQWVYLRHSLNMLGSSELYVFVDIAFQMFSFDYDIPARTMAIQCPSNSQQRFSYYLVLTIHEQLWMAQHRLPAYRDRIQDYDASDDFPQRHAACGVEPHYTTRGDWMYSVRTPSIVVRDFQNRVFSYPLIIEVCDARKHEDEEAMARDYLLGNDDRPSLFLSITLWLEGHNSARLGTYSLWRSRVLPGQPAPVGGFYGNGTEYVPECLVRNERFTAPGGNADAGDGEIFFSFADLAPRCQDWIRSTAPNTWDGVWARDGITISYERLSHIWQLARARQNYVESREYLMWEEERYEEIHGSFIDERE